MEEIKINDIKDFKIGNAEYKEGSTGCTVIICANGATAGVDVRGGAPGTRETDLLNPVNMVDKIHGVLLTGGSAFGLDAASGVMQYLEERQIGFDVGVTKVPIVCSAALFDLIIGDYRVRPDKKLGYEACVNSEKEDIKEGNYGAGLGATIGKILGPQNSMKGGLGTYAVKIDELMIGAIVAVNALGDVYDSEENRIIAGVLDKEKLLNTESIMVSKYNNKTNAFNGNTTIGAIITNGKLTKAEANKIASMAHNGFARSIRPVHTMFDGDTIFTMASGKIEADVNTIGMIAANIMEKAVINAIKNAEKLFEVKSFRDLK
jgi:L-aminopeptidase/D-esterase-like protein